MTAPLDRPGEWTELLPHVPGRRFTSAEPFAGHLVLHEWSDAQPKVRVLFRDGREDVLDFGAEPHDVELGANPEWDTTSLRLSYQSLTTPAIGVRPSTSSPASGCCASRRRRPASTSTATCRRGRGRRRRTARGCPSTSSATSTRRSTGRRRASSTATAPTRRRCRRGSPSPACRCSTAACVWALVHPRGGGELGRQWYLDGKLLHKRNTFTDTLAAVEHLVAEGVGRPGPRRHPRRQRRRPARRRVHHDAPGPLRQRRRRGPVRRRRHDDERRHRCPLTVNEWEEWGDPRVEPYASYMLTYSPYDNTDAGDVSRRCT